MIFKAVELDNNFFGEMRHRIKSQSHQRIQRILSAEECSSGQDKPIE